MKLNVTVSTVLLFLALFALTAQTGGQLTAPPPGSPAREPGLYVRFETTMGNITAKLFEAEAPKTVKNFVDLAEGRKAFKDPATGQMVRRPLYNGVTFHRVIPGFMLQTGDPTGTGAYDAGFTIPDEFTPALKFDRPGRLGMANIGQKDTGSCQFFITEVPTPHLNNVHTIFGQVIEGQDLVPKIANVPRDQSDKPRTAVRITKVVIERVGPPPVAAGPASTPAKK
jgi:peptidyl-prolyl cis-trans isomerase A (cyclophilin A)